MISMLWETKSQCYSSRFYRRALNWNSIVYIELTIYLLFIFKIFSFVSLYVTLILFIYHSCKTIVLLLDHFLFTSKRNAIKSYRHYPITFSSPLLFPIIIFLTWSKETVQNIVRMIVSRLHVLWGFADIRRNVQTSITQLSIVFRCLRMQGHTH